MANHKSAKKSIRQIERRTAVNKNRLSRIRTFTKKVEVCVAEGNKTIALEALRQAESEIMRGVSKGITHMNAASRKISRLSKKVKALPAA